MSLFRFTPGQTAREIPGGTWNALVDGEERDAKRGPGNVRGPEGGGFVVPPNPCRLPIVNRSDAAVPTGGVLKVTGVHVDPSLAFGAEYAGPMLTGDKPVVGDLSQTIVIASEPIRIDGVGWATIAGAAFAKVNITNAGHNFAKPKATVAEFDSDGGGVYPIIWKEATTGVDKWAVVLLTGAGSSLRWGEATSAISATTAWGSFGSGNVQPKDPAGSNDGAPIAVENRFWDSFDNKSIVCYDEKFDPPRIVSVGCTPGT